MRTNLPVTGNEVLLNERSMIVSKTDLKGCITYVNKDFLEISGFTEKELIGQPHNIVRHPDMPAEAFQDLWNSLKQGRPWVGYVKNRCKNGDHYWVEAHVAPIWENGQVTGYMSVRRKPARDQLDACEKAYRNFREGKADGLQVLDGRVVGNSALARMLRKLRQASLTNKLVMGCAIAAVLVMGLSAQILGARMSSLLEAQGVADLRQNLGLIRGMIEVRAFAMQREAIRLNDLFVGGFTEGFTLEDGEQPTLRHGKTDMTHRTVEVDGFTAASKVAATVFMRKGDDFVRIATSLKNDKGERAVDTPLGKEHPARTRLLAGERYSGKVKMFGKDYFTSYAPIKSQAGQVIGAMFIGIDVSAEITALKNEIKKIKVGDSGYFFVLDAKPGPDLGMALIHPAKEGQSILGAKDADGREFIKAMIDQKQGEMRYPWANQELGDSQAREKIAVFATFGEWQWLIGGGTYMDEFEAVARSMKQMLMGVSLLVGLILVGIIVWLVRSLVYRPLNDMVLPGFRALSAGKYDNALDTTRDDEIGKVLQGMETMQNRLGFEVAESKRQSEEMARILGALDNSTACITISGADGNLIYMTPAGKKLLNSIGGAGFDAASLVGGRVTDLITDPVAVEKMNAAAHHGADVDIEFNAHHLRLAARPIIDAHGAHIGRVTQWLDRTAEVTVEREVEVIIQAAANGDFTQRLSLDGKDGFFRSLSDGLNRLVDTTSAGLAAVAEVLNALARGDLTESMDGDYQGTFGQLKDDTNTTVERLKEVVGRIKEATEAINTAAQEIAAGNQDLSSRTEEQASSLEETASSMEELNATVRQNAESARQANELAVSSNEIASRGGQMVKQVVQTMSGIQSSSQKIADIVGVIDSIAFQTNILALNAAVEAARAGEQGRGFAVVASEVRNLAQRSATAAKEIKLLISESVDKVESGAQLVHEAGNTMDEVVSSFQQVTRLVVDISNASREQSSGIEQVTQAVSQMDEVTQQNAALVEEAAAAAESLEEQARGLVQAVGMFKLSENTLPGPALRDATPKQLGGHTVRKVGAGGTAAGVMPKPGKAIPPPHLADDDEEWAEF
ncbi:Cache 3/Cache 2 fusion domain-containing protein [Rhodocyclaceae bacterium]